MALRHRDIATSISDRENININARPGKAETKQFPTRRPAFDELSNKLKLDKAIAKKVPVKEPSHPAPKEAKKGKEAAPKSYSTDQLERAVVQDAETSADPQMVPEYLDDIFHYLRELEAKYPVRENFMEGHGSSPRMRTILVNWLVQVHMNFSLCLETLHMCVSIVDRYLQNNPEVNRQTLQLVGTSAMLIACKYEEVFLPDLSDFEYICDKAYSDKEILQMEKTILNGLSFNLGKPLSIHFLRRFSKLAGVRLEQHNLAKYLLELALLDHKLSHIRPSHQAAAACCLSIAVLSGASCPSKIWTTQLAHQTGCRYKDFEHVMAKFAQMLLDAEQSTKCRSIQNKYAEAKYGKISTHYKLRGILVKKLAEVSSKA